MVAECDVQCTVIALKHGAKNRGAHLAEVLHCVRRLTTCAQHAETLFCLGKYFPSTKNKKLHVPTQTKRRW